MYRTTRSGKRDKEVSSRYRINSLAREAVERSFGVEAEEHRDGRGRIDGAATTDEETETRRGRGKNEHEKCVIESIVEFRDDDQK